LSSRNDIIVRAPNPRSARFFIASTRSHHDMILVTGGAGFIGANFVLD